MSITLKKISKNFNYPVLKNIDLDVKQGEYLAIMGSSGVGKSTLLKILALQLRPDSGIYTIDNQDINVQTEIIRKQYITHNIGYVDQEPYLFDSLNVIENILLGLSISEQNQTQKLINQVLVYFDINHLQKYYPYELSGGERQRVVIVKNILINPKLLLMDEPTSSLDYATSNKLMELLDAYQKEYKITTIIVTHNPTIAKHTNRTIIMNEGKIYADIYKTDDSFEQDIINAQAIIYRRKDDRE